MEILGFDRGLWLLGTFLIAALCAMLCRGLGKATEQNPEFLANMGFWWCVVPTAALGATAFFPPLNVSELGFFGWVFGIVPIVATMMLRKEGTEGAHMFGRDDQGRINFLGSSSAEVITTLLYGLLAYELTTIFLWDELYRV